MYFSRVKIQPNILKSSQLSRVLEGNVYGSHRLLWDLFPEQDQRTFLYREEIAREQLGALPAVRGESIYYLVSQTQPISTALFDVQSKIYHPQLQQGQRLGFDCRANPVITRQGKKHDIVMDAQHQFLTSLVKDLQLDSLLPAKPKKIEYKKCLLTNGGEALNLRLTELLANDLRYAERLEQIAQLADKLEWVLKAQVDTALENWMKKQGERFGFELLVDDDGLSKLQNSGYLWHGLPAKAKPKGVKSGFSAVDFCGELQITNVQKFEQALFQGIGRAKAFGCGLLMIRRT